MEAHSDPDTLVSDKDVTRVVKGITEGKSRDQVFPKLSGVSANLSGEGIDLEVRFVRSGGMPVTYVSDGADASAVRIVDLHKKYYLTASELATKLGVTAPRATAVRRHVGADTNPDMSTHSIWARCATSDIPTTPTPQCLPLREIWTWAKSGRRTAQRTGPCRPALSLGALQCSLPDELRLRVYVAYEL